MRAKLAVLALAVALFAAGDVRAVEPGEVLADPALEARARALGKGLRCLVCQNQSIDDSNADLARDLRVVVRERLVAGDSDREVVDFVVARYGDFVLLNPPFKPGTWILWLMPPAVFVVGAVGLVSWHRRRAQSGTETPPLSPEEERRIAALIDGKAGEGR